MWYVSATQLLYWAHHASTLFNSICRVISSQSRGSIRKVSITKKFRPFSDFLLVPCTKKRKLFLASLSMSKWHHPHQQRPFITIAEKSMHLYIVLHMSFLCHICVTLVPSFWHHLFLISVLRLKVLRPAVPCACIISRVFCICEPRVLVWRGRAGAETTWRTGASSWRDGLRQIWVSPGGET